MFGAFWNNINTVVPQHHRSKSPANPKTFYVARGNQSLRAVSANPLTGSEKTRGSQDSSRPNLPEKEGLVRLNTSHVARPLGDSGGTGNDRVTSGSSSAHPSPGLGQVGDSQDSGRQQYLRGGGSTQQVSKTQSDRSRPYKADRQSCSGTASRRQRGRGPAKREQPNYKILASIQEDEPLIHLLEQHATDTQHAACAAARAAAKTMGSAHSRGMGRGTPRRRQRMASSSSAGAQQAKLVTATATAAAATSEAAQQGSTAAFRAHRSISWPGRG